MPCHAESRQTAGLIPGGKSLSGGTVHSPSIRVVLSEDTAADVKHRAELSNMSMSKWIRKLIEKELREAA
jgi:hypothetical protein